MHRRNTDNREKIRLLFFWFFLLFLSLFFSNSSNAFSNVSLNQSILPVKFVYLDVSGKIDDIWSNVAETDSLYVVKFMDAKRKTKIETNERLLGAYQEKIKQENNFSSGSLTIDFVNNGKILEEVRTYV